MIFVYFLNLGLPFTCMHCQNLVELKRRLLPTFANNAHGEKHGESVQSLLLYSYRLHGRRHHFCQLLTCKGSLGNVCMQSKSLQTEMPVNQWEGQTPEKEGLDVIIDI